MVRAAFRWCGIALVNVALPFLPTISPLRAAGDAEEFIGPFASWADVRRDYRASGDGITDDSAAFQRALDELRRSAELGTRTVLYVPAGTYRLTRGLTMASHIYVTLVGEDPSTTILLWDGPADGVMLFCNGVRYSSFGRLTWDGRGRARTAVAHLWDGKTPNANSGCEHADEVFKDVGNGIQAGIPHLMDAECAVQRCRFERCSRAGISIGSMNALDWWIWYCRFDGCRVGATNCPDGEYGGGHCHVYESQFRGSTEADITVGHASYFGIRNNTSVGSKAFFLGKRPQFGKGKWADDETWGAQIKLQGNRILDPQDAAPIRVAECGPLVMMDNVIRGRPWASGAAVEVRAPGAPDVLAVGNTFTVPAPFDVQGRLHELDTKTVARNAIDGSIPELPDTPPRRERKVFEVSARSGAVGVQGALNEAGRLVGQRPVVHLSPGMYAIDRPLFIPTGSDVQLLGDGERSSLRWTGRGNDPVLRVAGPSHATLRHFSIAGAPGPKPVLGAGASVGIQIDGCDQPGGMVFGDQLWASGTEFGIRVDPLQFARVQLADSSPRALSSRGVMLDVEGSRVSLFGGATSGVGRCFGVDRGGQLLVRDTWYEGASPRLLHLGGSGAFTLDGASLYSSPKEAMAEAPLVVSGFRGPVTLLGVKFSDKVWLSVRGDIPDTEVLYAGSICFGRDVENQSTKARVLALNNRRFVNQPRPGTLAAVDQGAVDATSLRALLAQDRDGRPTLPGVAKPGVSCIRLHRVWLEHSLGCGLRITGDAAAK
jgi:hypothetical protein